MKRISMGLADKRSEPADIALLACVLNGDEAGLAALLDRHWHSLVRYSWSIIDDWDAAEGVVEEVFVRLWERRDTWGLESSVLGLLFRLARELSLDENRIRDESQPAASISSFQHPLLNSAGSAKGETTHAAILNALTALPQRRREIFVLVRHYGLSCRETADALRISSSAVADQLTLALADLRESLGPLVANPLPDLTLYQTGTPASGSV